MAFDETLARRIRAVLDEQPGIVEKKMFGGVAWMLKGNMACGVIGDELMVRVGPDAHDAALAEPFTHTMQMVASRPPSRGMIMVAPAGIVSEEALGVWIERARSFTATLPAK